jgi:hypothetical protein
MVTFLKMNESLWHIDNDKISGRELGMQAQKNKKAIFR